MNTEPAKKFSFGKAIVLASILAFVVGAVSVMIQTGHETFVQGSLAAGSGPVAATTSASATVPVAGLGSSFTAPGVPVRLVIPAIALNANIQEVGMSWSGVNIGVPTNFTDVGWFKYGPLPGMPGTAIIDGHLDGRHVPQAVFFNLQNLKAGDEVDVADASGTTLRFQVLGSKLYDYTASTSAIFATNATGTYLDLITCAGDWVTSKDGYNERIVVFTQLMP